MINPKTFRAALKTLLEAALPAAKIFAYPPGKQADRRFSTLWLDAVQNVAMEDQSIAGDESAVYQITGRGFTATAGPADSDWANGEDGAYTLISTLASTLEGNTEVGGANHTRVTDWSLSPSQDDNGNVFFDLEFTITAWYWS